MTNGKKKKSKAAEYKEKLKRQEEAEKELSAMPSTSLKAVLETVDKTLYVKVPGQKKKLPYKRLDLEKFVGLQKKGLDRMELGYKMLYEMLHAADKNVSEEDVGKLPFDLASELLAEITKQAGFLPKQS